MPSQRRIGEFHGTLFSRFITIRVLILITCFYLLMEQVPNLLVHAFDLCWQHKRLSLFHWFLLLWLRLRLSCLLLLYFEGLKVLVPGQIRVVHCIMPLRIVLLSSQRVFIVVSPTIFIHLLLFLLLLTFNEIGIDLFSQCSIVFVFRVIKWIETCRFLCIPHLCDLQVLLHCQHLMHVLFFQVDVFLFDFSKGPRIVNIILVRYPYVLPQHSLVILLVVVNAFFLQRDKLALDICCFVGFHLLLWKLLCGDVSVIEVDTLMTIGHLEIA